MWYVPAIPELIKQKAQGQPTLLDKRPKNIILWDITDEQRTMHTYKKVRMKPAVL